MNFPLNLLYFILIHIPIISKNKKIKSICKIILNHFKGIKIFKEINDYLSFQELQNAKHVKNLVFYFNVNWWVSGQWVGGLLGKW